MKSIQRPIHFLVLVSRSIFSPLHLHRKRQMKKYLILLVLPFYIACQSGSATDHAKDAPAKEHDHGHDDHDHGDHEHGGHEHDHGGHDHDHGDHDGHDHGDHSGHEHSQNKPGHYGKEISRDNALDSEQMLALMGEKDELTCKLKAEVLTSCQKKGCWMDVKLADGELMKVTFKDYGFFVPKEGLHGKVAYLEGKVLRSVTDVATLQHYAQDAGKSQEEIDAITESEEALRFEAHGVIIEG